ncbi:hypothetical protein GCM10010234_17730 [Streptomyces hawaiiensis]|uniref:hypothetical protein n=1 Tax=Streptomyces hawaiiensis TaxID=67305 RepID=UPI0031D0A31E
MRRARVKAPLVKATAGAALAVGTALLGASTAHAQPIAPFPVQPSVQDALALYPPDPIQPIARDTLTLFPPDPIQPIVRNTLAFWPPGPIRPIIQDTLAFWPPDPIEPPGDGGSDGDGGGDIPLN